MDSHILEVALDTIQKEAMPNVLPPRMRLSPRARREELYGWLCVSPWVIGFLLLTIGPMFVSLWLSFTDANMLTPAKFIGLLNYQNLFSFNETKSLFWKTLLNTSFYVFFSVPLCIILGFIMALLLNRKFVGQGLFRTIYYLPSIIPPVATSLLWMWMFHRDYGVLNGMLNVVGIQGPAWLTSVMWAKPALVIMSLWGAGGNLLVLLAGLQSVPTDLYDAAKVDGANSWQSFWNVTFHMVSPTLFFILITGIIFSFQVFVSAYILTQGGPSNATLMYVLYLYRVAFQQLNFGFGSALAWVYFIIMMFFILLIFRSTSAWVYYEGELLGGKKK
jgi:multiple sugar transport system permease protein